VAGEAITDVLRVRGALKPLWWRITTSTMLAAVDYLKDYADLTGADFVRNPADIGIVSAFGDLRGPSFVPDRVHPLIWEFYEHTSRFHLTIVPDWRWWMKPAYPIYRTVIAKPLGQANAPFGIEEVQRGVVSWIDAIDIDHSSDVYFRAWVRSYESTGEPLYLGIYTVLQHPDGAYVSIGFPLPSANFTATLLPTHHRGDALLLNSRTELASPRPLPLNRLRRRRRTQDRPPLLPQRNPLPHPLLRDRTKDLTYPAGNRGQAWTSHRTRLHDVAY
jgi:hypothetical protein